jgi:hypothetical protein
VLAEGKHFFKDGMLQLPVGGTGESSPLQLPGLQECEGADAENEISENTHDYNRKGVLFKTLHHRCPS